MSYLRALDTARSHLDRGDLLAAKAALRDAHERWSASRVRAPLVEKGLEPALRRVGRWFGRRSTRPVLPVFGHEAAVLEDDLRALARLLRDEALAVLSRSENDLVEADRVVLENALRLDRESRSFSLGRSDRWQALRGYLGASRRLARKVDPSLLPRDPAGAEEESWLRPWCEAVLAGSGVGGPELLAWIERQADTLGRLETEAAPGWCWVAARAALADPVGGERALGAVERALRGGLPDADAAPARRLLAGLVVNETVLAGPGADVDDALRRWRPADAGAAWPPPELAELLSQRRAVDAHRALACAAWDDDAAHLVVVLHDGATPRDVLALAPRATAEGHVSRFEASLPEARGWIQRWLPRDTLVLVDREPPPQIADLLAGHPRLDVAPLLDAVPADARPAEPEPPGAPHPLWSPSGAHPVYRPLAQAARTLVPRLRSWAVACPAFSEAWGRDALTVMAEHGLESCGVLRAAIDRLLGPASASARALQRVDLVVPLQWPRLEARDWPAASSPPSSVVARGVDRGREGCFWFDHVAGVDEIVAVAAESTRAEILTATVERARAMAGRAAHRVDPRAVTVAPERVGCPEPMLGALDGWMRAAVGDVARQRDVLWLWRLLSETPAGEITLGDAGGDGTRERAVRELLAGAVACDDDCRLRPQEGCWNTQLESRRAASRIWIVPFDRDAADRGDVEDVLIDDARQLVGGVDDSIARASLERVVGRALSARRTWSWLESGALDAALRTAWRARVDRPLVPAGATPPSAASVLLAPPGYRLGDSLLSEEARVLVERRAEAWTGLRDARCADWSPVAGDGPDTGDDAEAEQVVTRRLAGDGETDPLMLLLRAAAAQSWARARWVCLDPRLAATLGHAGGVYPEPDTIAAETRDDFADAVRATVEDGRRLLDEHGGRSPATWSQPITASRLRVVARERGRSEDFEAEALAGALREWARARPLVVGGASDRQRDRVIDLVRALAERTGDGGALGVRCVFVVGARTHPGDDDATATNLGPDDAERLGAVMLEAERGRLSRVDLDPALLRDDALRSWARRVSSVAWIFPRADAAREGDDEQDPGALLSSWRETLERSGAAALVFVDAVDDTGDGELTRWAGRLDARTAVLPAARRKDAGWRIDVETVGPVTVACWRCTRSVAVEHVASRCPSCEASVADDPGSVRAAASAVEDLLVHRLHARRPRTWWAITSDHELAECVRERLGLSTLGADQAPLLAAVAAEPDDPRVLHVSELEGEVRPPAELLWLDAPAGVREIRRVLQRLAAMEAAGTELHVLLAPVGLHMATPRELRGRWRWTAKRTEVEFRLRAFGSAPGETIGLRPESPGPALRGPARARRAVLVEENAPDPRPEPPRLLDALEAAGPAFGAPGASTLDAARIPPGVTDEDVVATLRWAEAVGVLDGSPVAADAVDGAGPAFERALRSIGPDGVTVADLTGLDVQPPRALGAVPEGALRYGIGRAADPWLRDAVIRACARDARVLVVVGAPTGRTRWQGTLPSGAEVVAVEELAMAFLDTVAREKGVRTRTRLLPAAATAEGEEARLRLMRDTSRRYARSTGRIPSLEAQDLRRAVQGETKTIAPAVAVDVDLERLDRCAAEARAEGGWLTGAELREASVNAVAAEPDLVERWRRRYPWVAVDGLHDLTEPMRAFVRDLFPRSRRWETIDPLLGRDPEHAPRGRDVLVADLPRETVRAIETLRRNEADDLGRIKTRGRGHGGGRVDRVRVLTLRAAADWLLENVDPDRDADRTGVVVAHEGDRAELGAALSRGGLSVIAADGTAALLADGPRHALAALHLLGDDASPALLAVLADLWPMREDLSPDERFAQWVAAAEGDGARDAIALRLVRLHALRGRVGGDERLRDAVGRLLETGVLDPVLDHDAASGRLRTWLNDHGHRSVDEVLSRVAVDLVARPAAPTRAVHLLGWNDLVGPDHDHLVAIGTGFEPVARTVRVLLRAPERVTLLYSERDPLA